MPLILYAAPTRLTDDHHGVTVGDKTLWIRVERTDKPLIDALFDAGPLPGETLCNAIPDDFAR